MNIIQCFIFLSAFLISFTYGYCTSEESELLEFCYDQYFEAMEVSDDYDFIITYRSMMKEKVGTEYLCSHFKNLTMCLGPEVIKKCLTMDQFSNMFDDPESLLKYYGTLDYECQSEYKLHESSSKKCMFNSDLKCTLDFKNCASLKQSMKDCAEKEKRSCGENGFVNVYNVIAASERLLYPQCKITLLPFPKASGKEEPKDGKLDEAIRILSNLKNFDRKIIKKQIFPVLIESLESTNPSLQLKAMQIFNISLKRDRGLIYEFYQALPNLINLCESSNEKISEKAINITSQIVEHSPRLRDDCIDMDLIETLTELVSPTKISVTPVKIVEAVSSTMLKIIKPQSLPVSEKNITKLVPFLKHFLDHKNFNVYFYSMQSFENLFKKEYGSRNDEILDDEMTKKIMSFLDHKESDFVTTALAVINNIMFYSNSSTQKFLQNNLLKKLNEFLKRSNESLHGYILITLEIICLKSESEIQAIIDANLLPQIIKLLKHPEGSINQEAIYVVERFTKNATPKQIEAIFEMDIVWHLCDHLKTNKYKKIIVSILKSLYDITLGLENMGVNVYRQLTKCGGLEFLEDYYYYDKDEDVKRYVQQLHNEVSDAFYWFYARVRVHEDV